MWADEPVVWATPSNKVRRYGVYDFLNRVAQRMSILGFA